MKLLWTILMLSLLAGCGYKPSSVYSREMMGQKVYTEVEVSLSDPENSVLTKDALNRALYRRLKVDSAKKNASDSAIKVIYKSIRFIPLQYNKQGYVVYYQAHIILNFIFKKGKSVTSRSIVGRYGFPIRPSAIISNDLRFKAIEQCSIKALDEFISYISAKGLLNNEK